MRTLTAQESKIYAIGRPSPRLRVQVLDANAVWRDLSNLVNRDWCWGVEIDESIDQPVATCTVTLKREAHFDSLAQLRTDTRPNLLLGSYSALIQAGREFKVEIAIMPSEAQSPASGDWREVFHGYIDEPDFASDPFTFTGRDLGGLLQDLWIEHDTRQYGSSGGTAAETVIQTIINEAHTNGGPTTDGTAANPNCYWIAGATYALRDRRLPTSPNGYVYQVSAITTGVAGGSQPTWPTTVGSTVVDGGVTWKCLRAIPQLYTPSPSSFLIKTYAQKPQSTFDAISTIAVLLGWDIRYFWDNGTSAFRLTFQQPPRGATTSLYTFDADHYFDVKKLAVSRADIRNKVQVTYTDTSTLDSAGLPSRQRVIVEDTTSQDTYSGGLPKFMEVAEAGTSQINSSSQATTMANAILSDLKDPIAEQQIETPFFYAAQLWDLYTFTANGRHYSADQKFAVSRFTHRLGDSGARTTLDTRGKPAGAVSSWIQKLESGPGSALTASFGTPPAAPPAPTAATGLNGVVKIHAPPPAWQQGLPDPLDSLEVHVSGSSGFTPSSATFKGATKTGDLAIADLTPGATYYVKTVPRTKKGARGSPSAEASFTAGYQVPGGMQPQVTYESMIFNYSFEANSVAGQPPDCWTMGAGTWGTDAVLDVTKQNSGANSVKFPSGGNSSARVVTGFIPVTGGRTYHLFAAVRISGATGAQAQARIGWFTAAQAGTGGVPVVQYTAPSSADTGWQLLAITATAPAAACYARVDAGRAGSTGDIWVDSVILSAIPIAEAWTNLTLNGTWAATAGKATPSYYLDNVGEVHLQGQAGGGANGTIAGTSALRAGCRPLHDKDFSTFAFNGTNQIECAVTVHTDGSITCTTASYNQVSLDGITFRAEQ